MKFKTARPAAQVEIIEGMNHVMKQVPPDHAAQVASYSDSTLDLSPRLGELIVGFIHGIGPRMKP